MAPKKTIDLKLDNPTSTFQLKHKAAKGLSQPKLEALYTELYNKFKTDFTKTYTGAKDKLTSRLWGAFKDEYGILLAPDPSPTPLGDGKPLFKVRFLKDGKPSVATSIQQQRRSWYTQIQTEGSPGTPFSLERTKNQFFEQDEFGRWFKQQIHHESAGVMEIEPYLEPTLRKLLSKDKRIRTQGLNEYRSFSEYTHKNNIILGDKAENFAGLTQSRHINLDESAHGRKAGSDAPGTTYKVTKRSGGSLFTPETRTELSRWNRTGTGPRTVWARMGEYYGLSSDAGVKVSDDARKTPIIPQNKSKPVDPKKIPKVQGKNFLKVLTQEFIDQGVDPEIAGDMAADAYQGVRTGKGKLRSRFIKLGGLATFASMADMFRPGSATSLAIHQQWVNENKEDDPGTEKVKDLYFNDLKDLGTIAGGFTLANVITKGMAGKVVGGVINPYVGGGMMLYGLADMADDIFTGGETKKALQRWVGDQLKYDQVDDPDRPGRTILVESEEKKAGKEQLFNLLRERQNTMRKQKNGVSQMTSSPKAKDVTVADNRAITNPAMDKELKRLGLTVQDLIDREKGMSGIKGGSNKIGPVKL